jgi:DNA-binding MarR family transcriptional regulator
LRSINDVTLAQASALARIEQSGPLRLGVLAQLEGTAAATMCRVIDSLEQRELIVRVADPDDGRANLVELSREGGTLLADLRSKNTEALRSALAGLSIVDRQIVARAVPVLERLSELLNRTER